MASRNDVVASAARPYTGGRPTARRLPVFYGWVLVAIAFITMGIGVNVRTAYSLFFPPILTEFGWDRGVTAGAFSFGFTVAAVISPFLGRLVDRRGPRTMMQLGIASMGVGLLLATLVEKPWQLYATLGFLVVGCGNCVGYTGHSLFLPNWFIRRRGLALSIAFAGVGVGSVVLLPGIQRLIAGAGWRTACWTLGLLVLFVLVPLNLLIRKHPDDLGLAPDGERVSLETPEPMRAPNIVDPHWAAIDWTLARALRTARFWWVAVGYFCAMFAWYAVQVHQTKYLLDIGFSGVDAAWALGFVALAAIPGQIVLGHVSDRIGREWVWTAGALGFTMCYVALIQLRQAPTPALLYVMVVSQGLLGYGLTSVIGAIPAEIFEGAHYGSIFGALMLATIAGGAVGPWVTGVIYDASGSYVLAFWLAIGCSVLSALAVWCAAPRRVRAVAGRIPRH